MQYSNSHDSVIRLSNNCGVFLIKYMPCWGWAMPTQLSQEKVDLYRMEVMADMLLNGSNTTRNRILATFDLHYSYLYQLCIYCDM